MDIAKVIKDTLLFQGLSEEKIRQLASRALYKKYKAGEMVIGEEDPIRSFYVVISGQLKLYRSSAEGKEQTIQLLGPGDPFGLCTAFATESFPASAMAITQVELLLIPGTAMEETARQEPTLLFNIIQILSKRLKDSMEMIESLALKEIPSRLASFLLHEAGRSKNHMIQLRISQRELSKILGATPEALSRALRKMANDGILSSTGRVITLLDLRALEQLAEGD
ncbi:MAG TPA: Crp/Fnr family transcriptional regulator [Smithella sp.]|nr:Crp/Fnr family transcriptional regulator [Smithella sp.]